MTARGIQKVTGYQALVAAVVALAAEDSQAGDLEAYRWIEHESGWWLAWLCPPHVDLEDVRARLLERARPPAGMACQSRLDLS